MDTLWLVLAPNRAGILRLSWRSAVAEIFGVEVRAGLCAARVRG